MLQILTCRMDLAAKYGTDAAIFLHNIVYWTLKNQSEERHFHEGRYWMQASLNGLAALYPLWSAPQIKRMIAKLRDAGILLVGDFNEDRMVRTNWYSPSDEILALYDDGIDTAAIGRNRKMHGTKSSGVGTKSENANKDKEESKEEISPLTPQGADKLFDQFWAAYPKKKGKEQARKAWKKLKPDKDLCRQMAAALKWQKQSQDWLKDGGQFIPYPASWLNGRRWEDVPDQPDETEERYI